MSVLVIGAGASIALHSSFQNGIQMAKSIADLCKHKGEFWVKILESYDFVTENDLITFGNSLRNYIDSASEPSIDEFLNEVNTFPEYQQWKKPYSYIGKTAIYYLIVKWENDFETSYKRGDFQLNEIWVQKFIPCLVENKPVKGENIKFVTFNYDRLIEKIIQLNGLSCDFWEEIIHVYGSIDMNKIGFGEIPVSFKDWIPHMGDFISIYDAQLSDTSKAGGKIDGNRKERAVFQLRRSTKRYFMGFGFNYFNYKYLELDTCRQTGFVYNLYSPIKNGDFRYRRDETTRIRTLIPGMEFKYDDCTSFISHIID